MAILHSMAIEFDLTARSLKELSLEALEILPDETNKIYWIHCDLNEPDMFNFLAKKLQLPQEIINFSQQNDPMSKIIDVDEALSMQLPCVLSTELTKRQDVDFGNLIIYLTPRFCFTTTKEPIPMLNEFISSYQKAVRFAQTSCFLLFLLFDNIVNDFAKILFQYELLVDQMDARVSVGTQNIYNDVIDIKQQVLKIKRSTVAVREILMRLSSRKISVISDQCRSSLYNLSNHTHMVAHESDSIRDMLNSLLDQIDNALMQRMSETMKVLTAFAAIFLPLTLITGIYGMNFHWMPELEWKYGYFIALFILFACGVTLFLIFKKKKWF